MIRSEYRVWQDELAGKRRTKWGLIGILAIGGVVWAGVIITVLRR